MVGFHGVETIRVMGRKQFESIFENNCGFVAAHFGMSEYKVWGRQKSQEHGFSKYYST
jgi:hypothetical protein